MLSLLLDAGHTPEVFMLALGKCLKRLGTTAGPNRRTTAALAIYLASCNTLASRRFFALVFGSIQQPESRMATSEL